MLKSVAVLTLVGSLAGVLLSSSVLAQAADNAEGKAIYDKYCTHCHGDQGDGLGVAAPYLKPAPRDFTGGKYKIRQTPTGSLPRDEDLQYVVQVGLPYTSMPGFSPILSEAQIASVVEYIKSFSSDFEDPEAYGEVFPIPDPPPYTAETVERGKQVYAETGCARCHGDIGYGDGMSAPTLQDDWGFHIRAADLSMPWTYRGGGTRRDIFRTMSSGFNGTPMPGFHGTLPVEDIWAIVDYIVSLSGGPQEDTVEAPYSNLLRAVGTEDELDLSRGAELFATAPPSLFPIVGQIVEPGRNFYPAATAISAQAVYNETEIAFRLTWHDMRAETSGSNSPDLQVPRWEEQLVEIGQASSAAGEDEEGGFWGAEEDDSEGSIWGDDAVEEDAAEEDIWGDVAAEDDAEDDIWGDVAAEDTEGGDDDDFWGEGDEGDDGAAAATGPDNEFSDAVALQFPMSLPEGIRKPYFIFGDAQNPIDLWFADLARTEASVYSGRGSGAITEDDRDAPEIVTSYENGEWSVLMKRQRKSRESITFEEGTFVPIAFSLWDGFNRERGNKRGLTAWNNLYLEPLEKPSPMAPMARAGLGVLGLELLIILLVRRKYRKNS